LETIYIGCDCQVVFGDEFCAGRFNYPPTLGSHC